MLFDDSMVDYVVYQRNLYAARICKCPGFSTTSRELRSFLIVYYELVYELHTLNSLINC